MSKFEECNVLLGKMEGCIFTDRIYLPVSPTKPEDLVNIHDKLAIKESSYWKQGLLRGKKDFYQNALDQWRRMRSEFDKHNEEKKKRRRKNDRYRNPRKGEPGNRG